MKFFSRMTVLVLSFTLACVVHMLARYPSDMRHASPSVQKRLASISYNPSSDPMQNLARTSKNLLEIKEDLQALSHVTAAIRTYSVTGPLAYIPAIAQADNINVSLGIWIKASQPAISRAEMERGISIARRYDNVGAVYVGNETLLRQDATLDQLRRLMREMRLRTGKPVTTGETWDVWMKHPELAEDADFVAAHILPYWEGVPAEKAVATAFHRYDLLRRAFPHKRIVIAEFGWPSGRLNHYAAVASSANQAMVLRAFVSEAQRRHIDYNIFEAVDQPWKTQEGDVGQFWGIMDAHNRLKFHWQGRSSVDPWWRIQLAVGILVGLLGQIIMLRMERATTWQLALSGPCSQIVGFAAAGILTAPFDYYLSAGYVIAWGLTVPLVGVLAITAADRMRELMQLVIGRVPRRLIALTKISRPIEGCRFVSIHVPVCNEAPEVVAVTLRALRMLRYQHFEVLVLANNCSSAELPGKLAEICGELDPRFQMLDLGQIGGFKAGALNAGLRRTSSLADIIAVVDADYVVDPDWLHRLLPSFSSPKVALVQAPQDHRDTIGHWSRSAMNVEYGTFFDIGMVQRNEHNAIIAHGTMLMLRRTALEQVGGWDEACICEDTELGLRLLLAGWRSRYTSMRLGAGLLPDNLVAYRMQRQRWAFGAMSILRKHWRAILSRRSGLTFGQRYHFMVGWFHWIADGFSLVLAVLNLCWFAAMKIFGYGSPPPAIVSVVILVSAVFSICHALVLLAMRPGISFVAAGQAIVCALALQMPIARAIILAAVGHDYPFIVTAKGYRQRNYLSRLLTELWPDLVLGTALITAAATFYVNNRYEISDHTLFASVMAVQSAPYLVAFLLGLSSLIARRRPTQAS